VLQVAVGVGGVVVDEDVAAVDVAAVDVAAVDVAAVDAAAVDDAGGVAVVDDDVVLFSLTNAF
tara:strand:+ start:1353 stop:1541 length:189 start_codon:yes stop_codon:yes gene_type:complete